MKLYDKEDVKSFIDAVDSCESDVYLISVYGDRFNVKSKLSQYVAIGRLIEESGSDLEVFCSSQSDEVRLLKWFREHADKYER